MIPEEGELAAYNFNVGHQEVSRILLELEQYATQFPPDLFVPLDAACLWLCIQLGYGDNDELEDALLEKFLKWFPQFQVEGDGKISL